MKERYDIEWTSRILQASKLVPFWDPFAVWMNINKYPKIWNEITYPFPIFSGYTVKFWELVSNIISHFTEHVIIYPCERLIHISKGVLYAAFW